MKCLWLGSIPERLTSDERARSPQAVSFGFEVSSWKRSERMFVSRRRLVFSGFDERCWMTASALCRMNWLPPVYVGRLLMKEELRMSSWVYENMRVAA